MTLPSRRRDDPREIWGDAESDKTQSGLVIPPTDLWDESMTSEVDKISDSKKKTQDMPNTVKTKSVDKAPHCWAFMGSAGGVGTTSFAVQIAYELVKKLDRESTKNAQEKTPQVCLIDLDFESGNCAHHLDILPSINTADIDLEASRIDVALAQTFLTPHKSGLHVMAAAPDIGANSKVKADVVLALLDAVTEIFPYVILDLPTSWQSWSYPCLAGSDFIGLISDMTIPSLQTARAKYTQCNAVFNGELDIQIILNKYERRIFKNTLKLADAEKVLQTEIFGTSCADPNSLLEALNCGIPVGELAPDGRYAKDSRKLLQEIISTTELKKIPSHDSAIEEA